uniref:Uncharacterized protein n=1 Tax=Siphoviridae sp. ctLqe90 TaxID=2825456 RepID=A0A8S5Q2J8_9CAUD|nr:MAG TPA: hypothetical protein [Siphoviridae sp. ctLqe90]
MILPYLSHYPRHYYITIIIWLLRLKGVPAISRVFIKD